MRVTSSDGSLEGEEVRVFSLAREIYLGNEFRKAVSRAPQGAWGPIESFGITRGAPVKLELGEAVVPILPLPADTRLYARAGASFGKTHIRHSDQDSPAIVLDGVAIDPEKILVLGHGGAPAANVEVRATSPGGLTSGDRPEPGNVFWSDENGIAAGYRVSNDAWFEAVVLGAAPTRADPSQEEPPAESWRITLPPAATAVFTFPPGTKEARLALFDPVERKALGPEAPLEDISEIFSYHGDGSSPVTTPPLALGTPFLYEARAGNATAIGEIPPASKGGERILISPEFTPNQRIGFRLVYGGHPLPARTRTRFILRSKEFVRGSPAWSKVFVESPSDSGEILLRLGDDPPDLSLGATLEVSTKPRLRSKMGRLGGTYAVPPPGDGERTIHLGDLALERPPLLVSGMVTGPGGKPFERAKVKVERWVAFTPPARGAVSSRDPSPPLKDWDKDSSPAEWKLRTGADGAFEFRVLAGADPNEDARYHLRVEARGMAPITSPPFRPGTRKLKLELIPTGSMEIDATALAWAKGLPLEGIIDGGREGDVRPFRVPGRSELADLRPGNYSLRVTLHKKPLIQIDDIYVPPGGRCDDPRLTLQAAQRVETREYRVTSESGGPIEGAQVFLAWGLDGEWRSIARTNSEGRAELSWVRGTAPRIAVCTRGFHPMELTQLASGSDVALAPLMEVQLRFASGVSPPVRSCYVEVQDWEGLPRPELNLKGSLTGNGAHQVFLPGPGSYKVRWNDGQSRSTRESTIRVDGPEALVPPPTQGDSR